MRRLKTSEVPAVRVALQKRQGGRCPLCEAKIVGTPCLDHDHKHGHIRSVLCRNCNGIEGKIFNLVRRAARGDEPVNYLRRLAAYLELHSAPQYALLHPTHKTEEEKRLLRNKRAREARAKAKLK